MAQQLVPLPDMQMIQHSRSFVTASIWLTPEGNNIGRQPSVLGCEHRATYQIDEYLYHPFPHTNIRATQYEIAYITYNI